MMVAYPDLGYREVVERMSDLQRDACWHPDRVGVAALDSADPHQLDIRLNDRVRASAEHDQRTPDQRTAAIAQHTDEIRAAINYAGDGPPELTAALGTQVGFEARFRDVRGIEQRVDAEQAPARMLARAEHQAYAEKPSRDAAAESKAAHAAWVVERSPRSAEADTQVALWVATPPPAKETTAQPAARAPWSSPGEQAVQDVYPAQHGLGRSPVRWALSALRIGCLPGIAGTDWAPWA